MKYGGSLREPSLRPLKNVIQELEAEGVFQRRNANAESSSANGSEAKDSFSIPHVLFVPLDAVGFEEAEIYGLHARTA